MADQQAEPGARQRVLPEELRLSLPERATIAKYWRGAGDILSKVWNAPNTAIGLAYGGLGHVAGKVLGTNPHVRFGRRGGRALCAGA